MNENLFKYQFSECLECLEYLYDQGIDIRSITKEMLNYYVNDVILIYKLCQISDIKLNIFQNDVYSLPII